MARSRTAGASSSSAARIAASRASSSVTASSAATRVAGVETGEYHFAQQIKQDQYDRVKALPAVEARILKFGGWPTAVVNHKQGAMTNKKLRQALQAALDMEPTLAAGIGNKAFYRVDGALFPPEQALWHSQAATTGYNQRNKDKARKLLQDAGYKGAAMKLHRLVKLREDGAFVPQIANYTWPAVMAKVDEINRSLRKRTQFPPGLYKLVDLANRKARSEQEFRTYLREIEWHLRMT